jgi:hypothetical protein
MDFPWFPSSSLGMQTWLGKALKLELGSQRAVAEFNVCYCRKPLRFSNLPNSKHVQQRNAHGTKIFIRLLNLVAHPARLKTDIPFQISIHIKSRRNRNQQRSLVMEFYADLKKISCLFFIVSLTACGEGGGGKSDTGAHPPPPATSSSQANNSSQPLSSSSQSVATSQPVTSSSQSTTSSSSSSSSVQTAALVGRIWHSFSDLDTRNARSLWTRIPVLLPQFLMKNGARPGSMAAV